MTLKAQVEAAMKEALKNKQKQKLTALRAIKSELMLLETSGKGEVTAEDELKVLKKMVKQRKESAVVYEEQGRHAAAREELDEVAVIEAFLPEQLSQDEVAQVVEEIIQETQASSMKDMGKVMGIATKKLAGKADNKMVSVIVKQLLAK